MKEEQEYSSGHVHENEQLLLQQLGGPETAAYQAFTQVYHRYYQLLYQYIFPFAHRSALETQEVIQVVFVKLWLKRDMLSGVRYFRPYLFRMARNAAMDLYRQQRHRDKYEQLSAHNRDEQTWQTENELALKEYHHTAQQAIMQLPERRRMIFLLRTVSDLSLDEIAQQLSLSKDVVKKQLYLSVAFIKQQLSEKGGIIFFLFTILFSYVAASLW